MTHLPTSLVDLLRDPTGPLQRLPDLAGHVVGWLNHHVPLLAIALVGGVLARRAVLGARARAGARGARLIGIGVPPQVDARAAGLLWAAVHQVVRPRLRDFLTGKPGIAWEIAGDSAGIGFRLWVPATVPLGAVNRAVTAAWPGATTHEAPTPPEQLTGARPAPARAVVELGLSGPDWFPIGGRDGADPLRGVLSQLTGLRDHETALVQIAARPASARERRRLRAVARHIRNGTPHGVLTRLANHRANRPRQRGPLDPSVSPDVRAVLEKAGHHQFRCIVRIGVTASTRECARSRVRAVAAAYAAYDGRVGLRRRHTYGARQQLTCRSLSRRAFLASLPELVALAHLPDDHALPGIQRAGARTVHPPPGLTGAGKPFGRSSDGRPVVLAVADGRYHLHLLGPTGVGKSTLIARLALDDLAHRRGAVVIDPKGDLVEDILARVPRDAEDRVEILDPLDPNPHGLNVLDGSDHDLVTDQLVGIFQRVFHRFWGPRTDDILRAALLTLLEARPGATLADVPRLLTDDNWRRPLTDELDDPLGLEAFWGWYNGLSETGRAQAAGPVLSRLRVFLLRRAVRGIVGQKQSTLDVAGCLDRGRLLLVRVPKGSLGEDTSRLLGSFVVARVWQAALARAARPEDRRPDCALYVDEVHNYLNLPTPLEDMLAEARGYRLSLCLAHQNLAQLPHEMRDALAANARTRIAFQLSVPDATALGRDYEPELAAHDLANLPRHSAAVRLCHDSETRRPFTFTTERLPAADPERAARVREICRARVQALKRP